MNDYRMELPNYKEPLQCQNCFESIDNKYINYDDKPYCRKLCAFEEALKINDVDLKQLGYILVKAMGIKDTLEAIDDYNVIDEVMELIDYEETSIEEEEYKKLLEREG